LWGHDEVKIMPGTRTNLQSDIAHSLTVARGIGAFAFATLEEPGTGAAVRWMTRRRQSAPPVLAMGEPASRWVHATSIFSKSSSKKSAMEQDNDTDV
jgi:hypothetical protein